MGNPFTWCSSPGWRRWLMLALLPTILFFVFVHRTDSPSSARLIANLKPHTPVAPANLHVLVPADHKDANLCKTLITAAVAGFSTPTLINWGKKFDDKKLVAGGSHLAKISGVLTYLKQLDPERDNDLVLIVDGYDIWFQLRPSALIARYHAINAAANTRIRKTMGTAAVNAENIEQTILFSAQKRCWPWKPDDPPCYAVPESSLPSDAYGDKTDTDIGFEKNPYVKFRQRYLNSGDAIGRVGAMRALFERALELAQRDPNFGSDQKILSQIFGEQEYQREVIRSRHRTSWQRLTDWSNGRTSFLDTQPTREHLPGRTAEFGIGLDYASLIGHPTVFAEEDAEWLSHSDGKHVAHVSKDLGVEPPRVGALAEDIAESRPPFRFVAPTTKLAFNTSWSDVPLYTNVWTSVVPGLIHHNAHRDGLKKLRVTVWDRMWYFKDLRSLYDSANASPNGPIAVVDDEKGREQAWWPPFKEKGGAMSDAGEWLPWEDLCAEFDKEVFRDEKK
ncbi:unnamed protein product [Periconia digitata]|uniref:Uncharacterized protein n=1 Tax=Periconia digitata TaxID=1303443 RepID=A0A9W4UUQ9_9PLEO|nr:unnamed protein product [Periconia digitata]